MKKALTRTIIVFIAINLMTASFALAQNAPDEASREEAIAAQKQAEVVRRQTEATQEQIPANGQAIISYDEIMATSVAPRLGLPVVLPRNGGGAVLVIPAAQMKVEDLAAITEDMAVMSRIFDTKLNQAHLTTGRGSWFVGLDPFFGRDSRTTEAIYLEGYGALFLMKVNVLLSAPPETQQEKETEEEDTDPLWTQMRQEMYAPLENRRRRTARPEEKYDAEKVEDLKETLIKTLKHAANIRNLKPDESVILTVIGKAGQFATLATERLYNMEDQISYILSTAPGTKTAFSSPAVLTIRAKKADIDAFAKGQLSFDQFTQKTLLLSYSYLGGNVGGGPSRSSPTNIIYGERITRRSPR